MNLLIHVNGASCGANVSSTDISSLSGQEINNHQRLTLIFNHSGSRIVCSVTGFGVSKQHVPVLVQGKPKSLSYRNPYHFQYLHSRNVVVWGGYGLKGGGNNKNSEENYLSPIAVSAFKFLKKATSEMACQPTTEQKIIATLKLEKAQYDELDGDAYLKPFFMKVVNTGQYWQDTVLSDYRAVLRNYILVAQTISSHSKEMLRHLKQNTEGVKVYLEIFKKQADNTSKSIIQLTSSYEDFKIRLEGCNNSYIAASNHYRNFVLNLEQEVEKCKQEAFDEAAKIQKLEKQAKTKKREGNCKLAGGGALATGAVATSLLTGGGSLLVTGVMMGLTVAYGKLSYEGLKDRSESNRALELSIAANKNSKDAIQRAELLKTCEMPAKNAAELVKTLGDTVKKIQTWLTNAQKYWKEQYELLETHLIALELADHPLKASIYGENLGDAAEGVNSDERLRALSEYFGDWQDQTNEARGIFDETFDV